MFSFKNFIFILIIFLSLVLLNCNYSAINDQNKSTGQEKAEQENLKNKTFKDIPPNPPTGIIIKEKYLDVPRFGQETNMYCASASIKMVMHYWENSSPSQDKIAEKFPSYPSFPPLEINDVLNDYYYYAEYFPNDDFPPNFTSIKNQIDQGHPVISIEYYTEDISHVTVIYGYQMTITKNGQIMSIKLFINDPLPLKDGHTKIKDFYTYDYYGCVYSCPKPHGFRDLKADFFDEPDLLESSYVLTRNYKNPISFHFEDFDGSWPFSDLKLISELADGVDYSVSWKASLHVRESGYYTFYLEDVDDGAQVFIDGNLFIEKGWNYPNPDIKPSSDVIYLNEGIPHEIVINYEQIIYYAASLKLSWEGPDFDKDVVPISPF